MATYFARKAGNINAADVWATTPSGTASDLFPSFTSGDVLMANSFAITVNVSCNLGSTGQVRNDNSNGATAGGSFTLSNGVTLTANCIAGTTACVLFAGVSPNSASIVGNCTAGSGTAAHGCFNTGTGTLNVTGNCTGGSSASGNAGAANATGTLNITGNCIGGSTGVAFGAQNNSGTLNITGNCIGATGHGVNQGGVGTLNITGNLTGGTSTPASGANNNGTGSMFVTGSVYASEFDGGVASANRGGLNFLTGPFYTSTTWGVNPIRCVSWRWATNLVNTTFIEVPTSNLAAKRNLVTPDNATNFPAASNVRSGTTYGIGGALTGTCIVPNPASVAAGVGVDNTIGTLTTPTANEIRDAVWQAATSSLTTAGSIGERLKNAATVATTGEQLATALTAP